MIDARASNDGDGVKIHRLAGQRFHRVADPFLMIDEINSDDATAYIGGFPEHPHRGFETITYMKTGRMRHQDHLGNEGVIGAGDVQWMTAGAGVLHSEMPEQEHGLLHGFQIWLNLPAAEKMKPAAYHEFSHAEISMQKLDTGGIIRIIAGDVDVNGLSLSGPMPKLSTEPLLVDLQLLPNEEVELFFNENSPALVYVYAGAGSGFKARQLAVYSNGEKLHLKAGSLGMQLLVLSGKPINEPIVQYGPFVMNTHEQIEQAFRDLKNNRFVSAHSVTAR